MICKIVLVVIASFLLEIQPSTSSPIENENLISLSERFDKLQSKVESLEVENAGLKIRVDSLQIKVNHLEVKDMEKEAKIRKIEQEIIQLKTNMDSGLFESIKSSGPSRDEHDTDIRSSNDNKMSSIHRKGGSSDYSSVRAVAPSSCRDLSLIGHILDGLYLVKNPDTKKVETVLCIFGTSIEQEPIGIVDVKTKPVHFYVQRDSSFDSYSYVTIPFDVAPVNQGEFFQSCHSS